MIDFWRDFYAINKIDLKDFVPESESKEYFAADILFNQKRAKFRIAKITPKKIGQFVTLWKREYQGPIEPFQSSDTIDYVIIAIQDENKIGHFIFPKQILCDKGIFTDKKEGKRAIRVYPPWVKAGNPQAIKTQMWQSNYFFDLSHLPQTF